MSVDYTIDRADAADMLERVRPVGHAHPTGNRHLRSSDGHIALTTSTQAGKGVILPLGAMRRSMMGGGDNIIEGDQELLLSALTATGGVLTVPHVSDTVTDRPAMCGRSRQSTRSALRGLRSSMTALFGGAHERSLHRCSCKRFADKAGKGLTRLSASRHRHRAGARPTLARWRCFLLDQPAAEGVCRRPVPRKLEPRRRHAPGQRRDASTRAVQRLRRAASSPRSPRQAAARSIISSTPRLTVGASRKAGRAKLRRGWSHLPRSVGRPSLTRRCESRGMSAVLVRSALEVALATVGTNFPTAYENAPYTPIAGTAFQRVTLLLAQPANDEFGAMYREEGFLQVDLNYPLNAGPGAAATRAELIRSAPSLAAPPSPRRARRFTSARRLKSCRGGSKRTAMWFLCGFPFTRTSGVRRHATKGS
jgi:hypothetical protein